MARWLPAGVFNIVIEMTLSPTFPCHKSHNFFLWMTSLLTESPLVSTSHPPAAEREPLPARSLMCRTLHETFLGPLASQLPGQSSYAFSTPQKPLAVPPSNSMVHCP